MKQGFFFRRSLLWRLTGPCLLGLVLIAAANTGSWLARFQTEIESSFFQRGDETTHVIADAVANAVWNFDGDQADEIMRGFSHFEGYFYAEVLVEGKSFARYGILPAQRDGAIELRQFLGGDQEGLLILDGFVLFRKPVFYQNTQEIGVLVTGFSIGPAHALLSTTRTETILLQLLSFSLLGFLLTFVLRSVTRPLRDITAVIDDVTSGNMHRNVPFLTRADEVGRLAGAVATFQKNAEKLVSVQAEAEASRLVAEQAVIDELTQLPNRRALINHFEIFEAEQAEYGGDALVMAEAEKARRVALLHMDLDGFKQINDTLGHKAGDHVLCVVADRLRDVGACCRVVARIGGDEFVAALTSETDVRPQARRLADDLIVALRTPSDFEGQMVRVGCSVGIAYHDRKNRDLFETLVEADIALYRAKANGKNQWVEFDEAQRRAVMERKALSDQIQLGIERQEFIPFFQPILDAQTGKICAVEVLARWEHPDRGLLGPDSFIDLAKELKVMRYVDRAVLDQAISVLNAVSAYRKNLPRLAVNVTVERLMEADMMTVVKSLQGTPVKLDVELLESAYLDDLAERVLWHIDELRELGVGIHIDDFGTGHSSLAGLLRVSPDVMKIDRRFVQAAPYSTKERALIESMIGIARTFEIETVCEGIETEEQAELVRKLGCTMLQGFMYHKPMRAEDLHNLLVDEVGKAAIQARTRKIS